MSACVVYWVRGIAAPRNAARTARVKDVPRELQVPAPFCTLGYKGWQRAERKILQTQ